MSANCGCRDQGPGRVLCRRHWNEGGIRRELDRCIQWQMRGPLNANDPYDQRVLAFYDQLCYWAAKGVGDSGSVGSIYSKHGARNGGNQMSGLWILEEAP
jgi:hypothetical protein